MAKHQKKKSKKAVWPPKTKRKNNNATVAVICRNGKPLMPTNPKRARELMKKGRAEIAGYAPFTIRLLDREDGDTQPIEFKMDTGFQTPGISICTEKRELYSEERRFLTDEPEKHRDRNMHRRNKRSRKRYRKPRYDNRKGKICEDGFPPSIRNKRDQHIVIFEKYAKVLPITDVYLEMGSFDTQVLAAVAEGRPLPKGLDYQHGPEYGFNTLRDSVFARDKYTCQVCGKNTFEDGVILCTHHIGYAQHDRSNRMGNLLTVCTNCHTTKNHQQGGKLWGLPQKSDALPGAAFMNSVRWNILEKFAQVCGNVEIHITYGSATKEASRILQQAKSHANDAYCMGSFHPKKRAVTTYWQKKRRNNRVLEEFHDAKYIDLRDGSEKSGKELSSDRTKRYEPRNGSESARKYRGGYAVCRKKDGSIIPLKDEDGKIIKDKNGRPLPKPKKGYRRIRHERYPIRPGDTVIVQGKKLRVSGTHNKGASVVLKNGKTIAVTKINKSIHTGGWERIQ